MAEIPDVRPHEVALRRHVVAEDPGFSTRKREQPGAQTQEGGLAGAVGPLNQDNLTSLHCEISTSERGKRPQQDHRVPNDHRRCNGAPHGR